MKSITGKNPSTGKAIEVTFDDTGIVSVGESNYYGDRWIAPGLIDLQVNGFAGHDLNDGNLNPDCVLSLAQQLFRHGVTTFLPTIITASEEQIENAVKAISHAREQYAELVDMIPGIHLEGPYISPKDGPRGAHPEVHVTKPDVLQFKRWQKACNGLISLVTLSPHWPESPKFIRAITKTGVHVAIGHTDASPLAITAAVDAGATLSTHLGNGISAVIDRHPNVIWSQLADDRLTASFIADGHHLPGAALKSMISAKGLERSVLVSDAAAPGGLTPGVYTQNIGGQVELSADGRLSIAGTPYLAGAARPLADCIAMAVSLTGISLNQALRLATINPAKFVGRTAELAPKNPADIIVFDWKPGDCSLTMNDVYKNGKQVYTHTNNR